jgi:plasmid maintenance system antidote protein VapI
MNYSEESFRPIKPGSIMQAIRETGMPLSRVATALDMTNTDVEYLDAGAYAVSPSVAVELAIALNLPPSRFFDPQSTGMRLRMVREWRKLKQYELAVHVGTHPTEVSRYERDQRALSFIEAARFARVLNVKAADLLGSTTT